MSPSVTINSIEVHHHDEYESVRKPNQYHLTVDVGLIQSTPTISGLRFVAVLTDEESVTLDTLLEKVVERIKKRLKESF